jgi:hypothetical protein
MQQFLGRIYDHASHSKRAILILSEAVDAWEQLVKQAANLSPSETIESLLTSQTQEAKQRREACAARLANLDARTRQLLGISH